MNILAIVPARGGSKRLPRKNVMQLAGKPLLSYTAEHLQASKHVSRSAVLTDDLEIASVARSFGMEVVNEPSELASNATISTEAVKHAVEYFDSKGWFADIIVEVPANCPIRPKNCIDICIETFLRTGATYCFAAVPTRQYMISVDEQNRVHFKYGGVAAHTSELVDRYVITNGCFVMRRDTLLHATQDDCYSYYGSDLVAAKFDGDFVDIDTEEDIRWAEFLLQRGSCDFLQGT